MSVMRDYIASQLLEPLKSYPTTIQDTLLTIISDRLEELYEYTKKFPEIIEPNSTRLDILQAIIDQFQFTIREEADIQEQISILDNILYLYTRRGSIDTIENMWKYYGGDLPRDIKVKIPSYNLFRYSVSNFSGVDVYPDSDTYRSGVYEVILNNSNYPIPKLKEFMLKELVAAGNRIYFTNSLYSILTSETGNNYQYEILENTLIQTNLRMITYRSGMNFSGIGRLSTNTNNSIWSGRADLFLELSKLLELDFLQLGDYKPSDILVLYMNFTDVIPFLMRDIPLKNSFISISLDTFYTSPRVSEVIERYLYDMDGNLITSNYPGYFILGKSLLGSEVE